MKSFYKLSIVFSMLSNDANALSLNPETILLDNFLGIPVILIVSNAMLMLLFVVISKFFQYLGVKKSKTVKGGFIKSVFIKRDVK